MIERIPNRLVTVIPAARKSIPELPPRHHGLMPVISIRRARRFTDRIRDEPGHDDQSKQKWPGQARPLEFFGKISPVAPVALDIDRRADGDALVEVGHILVQHAHAAGGDLLADAPGLIGAVDAEERVAAVLVEVEGAGAERVVEAGFACSAAVPA